MNRPVPAALLWCMQSSVELSPPFTLVQLDERQFSLHCRHTMFQRSHLFSPRLCESGIVPYSDAPAALCGTKHLWQALDLCGQSYIYILLSQPTSVCFSCCSRIASTSADAPHLHLLQLAAAEAPWLCQLVIYTSACAVITKVTRVTSLPGTSHFCHTHTHQHTHTHTKQKQSSSLP